ncbi:MAG: hypothetical protein ACWGSQ_18495 [Longimicrobiales bacterium]
MKRNDTGRAILSAFLVLGSSALGVAGCGILDEGGTPENARVIMEGGGGQAFQLVTSNDFSITTNDDGATRDIYFYSADSSSVTTPFDRRYSLGSGVRFYVKAFAEAPLGQSISMKVLIDGKERYSASSDPGDAALEFVYSFR